MHESVWIHRMLCVGNQYLPHSLRHLPTSASFVKEPQLPCLCARLVPLCLSDTALLIQPEEFNFPRKV